MPKKGVDKGHDNDGAELSDTAKVNIEDETEKSEVPDVKFKNGNGKGNGNGKKGKGKDVKRNGANGDAEKGDLHRAESVTESCGKSEISTATSSIVLDGKEDGGSSSNDDKDKEDDEDDIPKEPKLDGYFVVLGVIFVGTIVGVLVYFALADIVDPPLVITRESKMPVWFKNDTLREQKKKSTPKPVVLVKTTMGPGTEEDVGTGTEDLIGTTAGAEDAG